MLVRRAQAQAGCTAEALAAPMFKTNETELYEAAKSLALPLIFIDRAALEQAQPRCQTHSEIVAAKLGLASVAEACALAAAGPASRLLLPRIALGKTTCALAGDFS